MPGHYKLGKMLKARKAKGAAAAKRDQAHQREIVRKGKRKINKVLKEHSARYKKR